MRISAWISDVCSSDLHGPLHDPIPQARNAKRPERAVRFRYIHASCGQRTVRARQQFFAYRRQFVLKIHFQHTFVNAINARRACSAGGQRNASRSEEHTSELQSLMRISYAVFCLNKKTQTNSNILRTTN